MNNKPAAWELLLKRVDTGWKRYAIYETKNQVERALDRIKGPPLVCKIVPLYRQVDLDDDDDDDYNEDERFCEGMGQDE